MRFENALRWQRLWWFVSLDFVRGFSQDLWLRIPVDALQEHLRTRIDPETDLPTFGSDARQKSYLILTSLRDVFGSETLEYLCGWQKSVFVQGGDDRVEEFVWGVLASELFERANELKIRGELYSTLRDFQTLREKRLSEFKKRIAEASRTSLSVWDQQVIAAEGESFDTVLNLVTNICSSNIFTISWRETCTKSGPSLLEEFFDIAINLALEDPARRLIFSAETLPFPSSWEFDLEQILHGIFAASH
jgi:hypothetical protein